MAKASTSFWRDTNRVPIHGHGLVVSKSLSMTANGTVTTELFGITGSVEVIKLWGVVTTAFGSNVTAAYFRLNDQTAQENVTLNTGTTLSSAGAGSLVVKKGLATAAVTLINSTAGHVSEPTTLETSYFSPFVVIQKTGSVETNIEYIYTTNNTSLGAITFYAGYWPISEDGKLTAM